MRCFDCNLPDPYNGAGDGIGSCDCCRCEYCGGPPGVCNCDEDDYPVEPPCGDPECYCAQTPGPPIVDVDTKGLL